MLFTSLQSIFLHGAEYLKFRQDLSSSNCFYMEDIDGNSRLVQILRDDWQRLEDATIQNAQYPDIPDLGSSLENLTIKILATDTVKSIQYNSPHFGEWDVQCDPHRSSAFLTVLRKKLTSIESELVHPESRFEDTEHHKIVSVRLLEDSITREEYRFNYNHLALLYASKEVILEVPARFLKAHENPTYVCNNKDYESITRTAPEDKKGIVERCVGQIIDFYCPFNADHSELCCYPLEQNVTASDLPDSYQYKDEANLIYIEQNVMYRPHIRHELWHIDKEGIEPQYFTFFSYSEDRKVEFAKGVRFIGRVWSGIYHKEARCQNGNSWEEKWKMVHEWARCAHFTITNIPESVDGVNLVSES